MRWPRQRASTRDGAAQSVTKGRACDALVSLMRLAPDIALRVDGSGGGPDAAVPLADVVVGDRLRVVAGSRVPVDGTVAAGTTWVDESLITGGARAPGRRRWASDRARAESMPVRKAPGDSLVGGTSNTSGACVMVATGVGGDTVLAQIARLVQLAQLTKPPVQRFADRVSRVFAPAVLAVALATFFLWVGLWAAGAAPAWLRGGEGGPMFALRVAISVMVVACPCALGLATPTAFMVGAGVGAGLGVLYKTGEALEGAARVDCVVFDKTGTLTRVRGVGGGGGSASVE